MLIIGRRICAGAIIGAIAARTKQGGAAHWVAQAAARWHGAERVYIAHATCGSRPPRVRHSTASCRRSSEMATRRPSSLSDAVTSSDGRVRSIAQPKRWCSSLPSHRREGNNSWRPWKRAPRRFAATAKQMVDSIGCTSACAASAASQPSAHARATQGARALQRRSLVAPSHAPCRQRRRASAT